MFASYEILRHIVNKKNTVFETLKGLVFVITAVLVTVTLYLNTSPMKTYG
jgi:BRCT domain type II-containing protein